MVPEVAAHLRPCYLAELRVVLHGRVHYLEVLVLQAPVELLLRVVLMLLLSLQLLLLLQVLRQCWLQMLVGAVVVFVVGAVVAEAGPGAA